MKNLLLVALIFLPIISFANIPAFPMGFYGAVTIDGAAAPVDTVVRAYYGETLAGEVSVGEAGIYGYAETIKQRLVVSEGSGALTFTVQSSQINAGVETGGLSPVTHPAFISGETVLKNLTFALTSSSSGGSGSSGGSSSGGSSSGGGGSSSGSKSKTVIETVLGVSTTSTTTLTQDMSKVELQKQIIVLLTQLVSLLQQKLMLLNQ